MKHKCLAAVGAFLPVLLAACGGSAPVSQPAEPSIEQMSLATPIGKVSVPVDVRYQASGSPLRDQPMTLQLAFVPRVAGPEPARRVSTIGLGDDRVRHHRRRSAESRRRKRVPPQCRRHTAP